MHWIEVADFRGGDDWGVIPDGTARSQRHCEQLERGEILFFPLTPFTISTSDQEFLLRPRASGSKLHKNVSFRPEQGVLRGFSSTREEEREMSQVLRRYSESATRFVSDFLQPYRGKLQLDYASFRPIEEQGRDLSFHKRNDLLHVDAFPSRPTHGGRILRFFTNANPRADRVWVTGERFPSLAERYARDARLGEIAAASAARKIKNLLNSVGLPVVGRSAYDEFMLYFHDFLKENEEFQSGPNRQKIDFPPQSSWMVYTDGVSHSVLSGQYALEQTFIVPVEALVSPQDAPIQVLEKIVGQRMTA